LNKHYLKI